MAGRAAHSAPRRQKMAKTGGVRPGVHPDPVPSGDVVRAHRAGQTGWLYTGFGPQLYGGGDRHAEIVQCRGWTRICW